MACGPSFHLCCDPVVEGSAFPRTDSSSLRDLWWPGVELEQFETLLALADLQAPVLALDIYV